MSSEVGKFKFLKSYRRLVLNRAQIKVQNSLPKVSTISDDKFSKFEKQETNCDRPSPVFQNIFKKFKVQLEAADHDAKNLRKKTDQLFSRLPETSGGTGGRTDNLHGPGLN